MEIESALNAFGALSQKSRLEVFRLLMEFGEKGEAQGKLAAMLNMPHNSLSFHLNSLVSAGLIKSQKIGRQTFYSINSNAINELIEFMLDKCCVREGEDCEAINCNINLKENLC